MNQNFRQSKPPQIASLAERDRIEAEKRKKNKMEAREEARRKAIPVMSLVIANLVFLSLDARAIQAVYLVTHSYFLAGVTVLVSGIMALVWWDFMYPHAKRHSNQTQLTLALISAAISIVCSGVLAFVDYMVVGGSGAIMINWIWAGVVILTVWHGVAQAWYWSIDNHIAAEARRETHYAEHRDRQDEMEILRSKLHSLRDILAEMNMLNSEFGENNVRVVAQLLGIPLADANNNNIPDALEGPQAAENMDRLRSALESGKRNVLPSPTFAQEAGDVSRSPLPERDNGNRNKSLP